MKKHFGTYQLSFIDALAINDYFLPKLELYKKNIEKDIYNYQYIRTFRNQRRSYIAEMIEKDGYKTTLKNIKKELFNNLKNYPVEFFRQFKDLIIENSMQPSSLFTIKILNIISLSQSKLLLTINIISILFFLAIIILTKFVKEKNIPNDYILYIILIFFTIFFTYFSTGITFWQGDRFLVPIYYASIILFTCQVKVLFEVINNINQKIKLKMKEPFLEPVLRRMRIGKVVDEIKNIHNCNLLDVGCGFNHRFLSFIEPYIEHGTGVDFKVQELSYHKIKTINMTLDETLPFNDCSFDAVTMLAVLEHIDKPKQIISDIYRVLKIEGKLILTVPGKSAKPVLEFLAFKLGIVNRHEIEDHKKYYDLQELSQLVSDINGFKIIKHKHFQFGMNNFCVIKKTF